MWSEWMPEEKSLEDVLVFVLLNDIGTDSILGYIQIGGGRGDSEVLLSDPDSIDTAAGNL